MFCRLLRLLVQPRYLQHRLHSQGHHQQCPDRGRHRDLLPLNPHLARPLRVSHCSKEEDTEKDKKLVFNYNVAALI